MKILPGSGGGVFGLLLVFVLCWAAHSLGQDIEVVGYAEINNIKSPHAYSGLRVTIECKTAETKEHFITRGSGEVDKTGKFSLTIHHDIVGDDGTLKEACYAQLHSASGNPCPAHDGLEASKVVFLSKTGEKHVLGLKQNIKFSPEVCVTKFFWHMPKFPLPPPLNLPPFPKIKKPCPPKIKLPPLAPIYKPSVVIPKKPCPPKIAHKPLVPIYKPPVVIPKTPCPPLPKPIYKPPMPIYKPPMPIYKPPVVIPKKPCPPLPKLPPFPPKYIPLPKFGKWPPFLSHP